MINYDIMDKIKLKTQNDKDYIWTIYNNLFIQVHKNLFDGNPGASKEQLQCN